MSTELRLKTILELEPGDCRFPVGDPREPGFGFCGRRRESGTAYCSECANKCFNNRKRRIELEAA